MPSIPKSGETFINQTNFGSQEVDAVEQFALEIEGCTCSCACPCPCLCQCKCIGVCYAYDFPITKKQKEDTLFKRASNIDSDRQWEPTFKPVYKVPQAVPASVNFVKEKLG